MKYIMENIEILKFGVDQIFNYSLHFKRYSSTNAFKFFLAKVVYTIAKIGKPVFIAVPTVRYYRT